LYSIKILNYFGFTVWGRCPMDPCFWWFWLGSYGSLSTAASDCQHNEYFVEPHLPPQVTPTGYGDRGPCTSQRKTQCIWLRKTNANAQKRIRVSRFSTLKTQIKK